MFTLAIKGRVLHYPWLSFLTLGAFLVLCGLCYWQVERLYWKQNLIKEINATVSAAPLYITNGEGFRSIPEFHRVEMTGSLLHEDALHLQARYYKGNLGFHLITPMRLEDGSIIFLNRGWVPKDYKTNPKVKITRPQGNIHVIGLVRADEHPRSYLPQNDPRTGMWLWQDTQNWTTSLNQKYPNTAILPVLVQQMHDGRKDDGFPIPQDVHFELRNDHLQYAITWGSFALILVVIYTIYTQPNPAKRRQKR